MNSRQKGKRGELEFVNFLKARNINARRGQQYAGGTDSPDVIAEGCLHNVHIEVKRTERTDIYSWLEQAFKDAAKSSLDLDTFALGKLPVVAHKKNGKGWVAILDMNFFIDLMEQLNAQRPK